MAKRREFWIFLKTLNNYKSVNRDFYFKLKMELIKCYEKQNLDPRRLALNFKCGKTQVYEILKNRDKKRLAWKRTNGTSKRKMRKSGNEKMNEIVYD